MPRMGHFVERYQNSPEAVAIREFKKQYGFSDVRLAALIGRTKNVGTRAAHGIAGVETTRMLLEATEQYRQQHSAPDSTLPNR